MSKYILSVIKLRETWYLPLPKPTKSQMGFIADRLKVKGFTAEKSRLHVAKRGETVIHVDPSGICWSREDPSDAIAPALPDVLAMKHEGIGLDETRARYFSVGRTGGSTTVRFSTRMESSSLWTDLRSAGECGLTPDEREVVLMVVGSSSGGCTLFTDFPTEGSKIRVLGPHQYYESCLDTAEVSSTLRATGEKREKNSYLPRGGTLRFKSFRLPPSSDQAAFFSGLGEWCFLRPHPRKL